MNSITKLLPRLAAFGGAAAAALLVQPAAAAYVLAPQYAGAFAAGTGADAAFYRVDNAWSGSAVLWNEATQSFGTGLPIGATYGAGTQFGWGTGLWGQVDWLAVQQAAAGGATAASGAIVQSFTGLMPTINQGNSRYTECYSATWGPAALVPFFSPSAPVGNCDNPEAGDPAQQNWTARYSGFIRITDPGQYNFSVLNDDGFFFRLIGADGNELDIGRDYLNPRDRVGFDQNLQLETGLYGFELGAWNRLGAGVVDLRWTQACSASCDWTFVPTEDLVSSSRVPEPPTSALVFAALGLLGAIRQRARTRRLRTERCEPAAH